MKAKNLKGLFFVLVVCLLFSSVRAQIPLSLSYGNVQPPASVAYGDSFSFEVWVRNDTTIGFSSPLLDFWYNINGAVIAGSNSNSGFSYNVLGDTIPPGDSILRLITAWVDSPHFQIGPSVVVIWPVAGNSYVKDSLIRSFTVDSAVSSGLYDEGSQRIKLLVAENSLMLMRDGEIQIQELKMLDVLGREILRVPEPGNNIPLPSIYHGIYLAEISFNRNQKRIFRFYH